MKKETIYEARHPAKTGNKAFDCPVTSNAKIIEVSSALEAPAKIADMATNAASDKVMPESGKKLRTRFPNNIPVAPPMVSKGASVPPEVPLPKAIAHEMNFKKHKPNTTFIGRLPDNTSVIFS